MLAYNLVGPCKGFVPGLELQCEDEELHSTCFQKEVVILDFPFLTKMATLFFVKMGIIQWVFRESRWREIGAKMAGAGVARLSVYGGITHVVISRAQQVGHMIVDRLESAVGDLPLVLVFGLGDVSHMDCHRDVHLLLVRLDPFGLFEKTGALITNAPPMPLRFLVPDVRVALRVRKNDQRKGIGGWLFFGLRAGETQ